MPIPSSKYVSRAQRVKDCAKKGHPIGSDHDWWCSGITASFRLIDWSKERGSRFLEPSVRV